ncbi:HD domain-containing protein [Glaciihabitans tibetensis]|uniref:HD domain-containing protein n=1 Tax=Glaciihabitans tibetensis TaxID=1266600 RepID=A0A2T0VFP5_9MICO|nr:HD domain-containing protein [Glaciihabitans tibetensis]PRY69029.1 HD domain-containing protein [Glaciihabitans tibetensis]
MTPENLSPALDREVQGDVRALITPPTPAAVLSLEVVTAMCSPALLNHSIRSYAFGAALGRKEGVEFDPELLFVAAMLHDIALVPAFDSETVPFEEAGGRVAWVFGAGAGWSPARRERVSEVIVRHMWTEVDVALDAEGHLLERATSLDVSGTAPGDWTNEFRAGVVSVVPRLGFAAEFTRCIVDQAERKPTSNAARTVRSGLPARAAANSLDM